MATSFQRIEAAVVDGRARTPRYIQKQLTLLHDVLVQSVLSIHQAIMHDTGYSSRDAWFEIYVTLKALKQQFEAINFKETLEVEYSIANEKDNASKRVPYGCAYIVPFQHTRFYSIIQPIAAAIAAGNCVVVEVKQTVSDTDQLLRSLLTKTLDKDTFMFTNEAPSKGDFFAEQVVFIDNTGEHDTKTLQNSKSLQAPSSRVVAIVDRSANIAEAAQSVVRSRFHFNGKSPYSPDVVLVNEFALQEFCKAATQSLTQNFSDMHATNGDVKQKKRETSESVQKLLKDAEATTLISGLRGSIAITNKRNAKTLAQKVNEPILLICAVRSLDDAIDFANINESSLLSTYLFAAPGAAKYLGQFINTSSCFINHIPVELLVGPAAPKDFPVSVKARYTKEMFSIPSPEIIKTSADELALTELLELGSQKMLDQVKSDIRKPLTKMGEPETTTVGFFEQGLHTGALVNLTCLVGLTGVGLRYSVPVVLKRFR